MMHTGSLTAEVEARQRVDSVGGMGIVRGPLFTEHLVQGLMPTENFRGGTWSSNTRQFTAQAPLFQPETSVHEVSKSGLRCNQILTELQLRDSRVTPSSMRQHIPSPMLTRPSGEYRSERPNPINSVRESGRTSQHLQSADYSVGQNLYPSGGSSLYGYPPSAEVSTMPGPSGSNQSTYHPPTAYTPPSSSATASAPFAPLEWSVSTPASVLPVGSRKDRIEQSGSGSSGQPLPQPRITVGPDGERKYECVEPYCDGPRTLYTRRNAWKRHHEDNHGGKKHYCSICSREFKTYNGRMKHEVVHQ